MTDRTQQRVAVVTGGTDGIGKEVARRLAARNIQVAIVGRDAKKGRSAESELRASTQNPRVDFLQADLSLLAECRRLVGDIRDRWPALHYLVHSAGIVQGRRELTVEGIESNFATNYLSRYALTESLLPSLSAAGVLSNPARIMFVSGAARHGRVSFGDVNLSVGFSVLRAVMLFCRANDLYTVALARRLQAPGQDTTVSVTCLKVGVVKTNIRRTFPLWMKVLVPLIFDPLLGQSREEVAEAALQLLTARDAEVASGLFMKIRRLQRIVPTVDEQAGETSLLALSARLAFPVAASDTEPHNAP
jgi:NAD(P)-dependent dehydrogenase (short-subunit alcohol dehydrogenase family)